MTQVEAEARRIGMFPVFAHYSTIELSIDGTVSILIDGAGIKERFRAAILDGPGPYSVLRKLVASYLISDGIYVLNSRSFLKWPTLNKLMQAYELQHAGIPIVPTRLFGNSSQLVAAGSVTHYPGKLSKGGSVFLIIAWDILPLKEP